MNTFFQDIIGALRAELHEYGALLHIFQEQQKYVLHHDPEGFLAMNEGVEEQMTRIHERRRERERRVRETAIQAGADPDSPLTHLIPYCPDNFRPLLTALIEEINELLYRTQRRIRQNHMLLGQCLEMARQMVAISKPEVATGAYTANGRRAQARTSYSINELSA